jgi:hypothetical protein
MKILHHVCRILLGLLCLLPILGTLGVFPAPTADLYTPSGWAFMSALMASGYLMPVLGLTFFAVFVCVVTNRMALGAIILLPLTVNIVCFHAFVDTGLLHPAASMGIVLALLNAFFLWENWSRYKALA